MTLYTRCKWLTSRSLAISMLESMSRLQTRRIARQVGEMACILHAYRHTLDDMRHGVAVTESKMNNIVGIRRID